MFRQVPLLRPLRLLCMLSVCSGGLDDAMFHSLRRAFIHAYGFEHHITFKTLDKLGLFTSKSSSSSSSLKSFSTLREKHRLVRDDDGSSKRHAQYFGFAPLSAALIEKTLREVVLTTQQHVSKGTVGQAHVVPTRMLVMFIGGVTSAEMASLQEVSVRTKVDIELATTELISGKTLVESLLFNQTLH